MCKDVTTLNLSRYVDEIVTAILEVLATPKTKLVDVPGIDGDIDFDELHLGLNGSTHLPPEADTSGALSIMSVIDVSVVVLDELNKYAPRDGSSPIKEILLDVAERGRSLGVILIGAQQTASEIERRIISNSSIRVVGRLDTAESSRDEYGFLPSAHRQRSTIIKPGTMMVSQPQLPVPIVVEFPFPAWATRRSEAGANPKAYDQPDDPFEGLTL